MSHTRDILRQIAGLLPVPVRLAARNVYGRYWKGYARLSYSQEGEDLILLRYFEGKRRGFYVDVGAHHPLRFSNTHVFYEQGWSGLNIDAMPGSMEPFRKVRPRDINLEVAVAAEPGELTYFMFEEPAVNTLDPNVSAERVRSGNKLLKRCSVRAERFATILERHLPAGQAIDFLSIDVEGLDYEVLASNDWSRFRPEMILVECYGSERGELLGGSAAQLLAEHGYEYFAKTVNTVFFRDGARLSAEP